MKTTAYSLAITSSSTTTTTISTSTTVPVTSTTTTSNLQGKFIRSIDLETKFHFIMMIFHKNILLSLKVIDCVWSRWTYNGGCSSRCGRGSKRKSRTKIIDEENGGHCYGKSTGVEVCQDCSGEIIILLSLLELMNLALE